MSIYVETPIALLLAEDEPLIRMAAADALADAGYRVLEAGDAQEALAMLVANPDVALLITDVRMPGNIDGLELTHRVHERWPDLAIIVTSGHAQLRADDLPNGARFLPKPYLPPTLVVLAESLLAEAPVSLMVEPAPRQA